MSKSTKCLVTFLSLIILIVSQLSPIKAQANRNFPKILINSPSNNAITFEINVPIEEMVVELIQSQNQNFSNLYLPGFSTLSQAGAPQLPYLTEILGVPFDSEIHVSVIPGNKITKRLEAPVLPAISENVEWDLKSQLSGLWGEPIITNSVEADPAIYQNNAIFPGELGKITNDAVLRSQRLVSIALYPIQYDPLSNELVMYDRLMVTVEISGVTSNKQGAVSEEAPVFERFFHDNLLNYEQAKIWRENHPADSANISTTAQTPWAPPDPGWRIKVRETGFYKLTFPELLAAGVPIDTININTLKIIHLGEEIAIKVIPGEAVVFYGESIDSKYTSDNVYWLTYGGEAGLRMETTDGSPTAADVPESFSSMEHIEEDRFYRSMVAGDDDLDRYLWNYIYRNDNTDPPTNIKFNYNIDLQDRLAGNLTLKIQLIGYLQEFSINPDHRAAISINGTQVSEVSWEGFSNILMEVEVPSNLLVLGNNALEITALHTGHTEDLFFVDWLEVEYEKKFASESDILQFSYTISGEWNFVITEFMNAAIDIFDISDRNSPQWIDDALITDNDGLFSAEFSDNLSGPKRYFAVDGIGYLTVDAIEADNPSTLALESDGADYLMISHSNFLTAAARLQAQKTTQGLNTVLIDVQDIYDEFGYGITDVYAIRSFIAYAYEHSASSYVLLIGDGHFDPKNNEGYGRKSYIPPFLAKIDPKIGETAADNRYAAVAGNDTLPDLMLGRLSVNTTAEAQSIISKIITYETNPPEGDWKRQILAVTDNRDTAHFPLISESLLQDYFPSEPFEATKVYWLWTHTVLSEARADIQNALNQGRFLVNYIGHAGYSLWADEGLFTTTDIANLQPQDKLPVILAMTCLEGYFISPYLYASGWEAMGEVITRTEGKGAVASWSPTGWGSVYGHDALDRGFFKAVYQDGANVLSSAINSGILNLWATGNNLDLLDTFLLFGDPALQMSLSLTAVKDNYSVDEDETLSVTADQGVLVNDIYPDNDPLTVILVDDVAKGTLVLNEDGSFVYTPDPNYYGPDSYSYKVSNGVIDSNTVLVQIDVNPVNDPPVAVDQVVSTLIDTPVEIELTAIDDESGGSSNLQAFISGSHALDKKIEAELVFELMTQTTHGTLSGDVPFLVYTPDPSFEGMDQFTFRVNDGQFDSNIATVTINVNQQVSVYLPLISKP